MGTMIAPCMLVISGRVICCHSPLWNERWRHTMVFLGVVRDAFCGGATEPMKSIVQSVP